MEDTKRIKKITLLLILAGMVSFACLGVFSKVEKGEEIVTDYFTFTEPVLKDDPRAFDVEEFGDWVYFEHRDNEMNITLGLFDGDFTDTERQLEEILENTELSDYPDFKKIKVAGYDGLAVTISDFFDDAYNEGKITLINLEDETFFFAVAGVTLDEEEEAKDRYKKELGPMLDMILNTIEFYDLEDF